MAELAYSHGDSGLSLGDGVHRRGEERGLESDITSDLALEGYLRCRKVNVAAVVGEHAACQQVFLGGPDRSKQDSRKSEEVIVGQASVLGAVHELLEGETIAARVGLEVLDGSLGVEIRGPIWTRASFEDDHG